MGQYAESDIVLESNSLLRAVFFIPKNKERQVTIMRQAVTTVQYVFAGIGGFMGWFLGGLDGFEVDFDEAMSRGRSYLDFEAHAREEACNLYKKEVK